MAPRAKPSVRSRHRRPEIDADASKKSTLNLMLGYGADGHLWTAVPRIDLPKLGVNTTSLGKLGITRISTRLRSRLQTLLTRAQKEHAPTPGMQIIIEARGCILSYPPSGIRFSKGFEKLLLKAVDETLLHEHSVVSDDAGDLTVAAHVEPLQDAQLTDYPDSCDDKQVDPHSAREQSDQRPLDSTAEPPRLPDDPGEAAEIIDRMLKTSDLSLPTLKAIADRFSRAASVLGSAEATDVSQVRFEATEQLRAALQIQVFGDDEPSVSGLRQYFRLLRSEDRTKLDHKRENVKAVNYWTNKLGLELTYEGQRVSLSAIASGNGIWGSYQLRKKGEGTDRSTLYSKKQFPPLRCRKS